MNVRHSAGLNVRFGPCGSFGVAHSDSREPGGQFRVRVERHGDRVRVEVCDQGGPWAPAAAHDEENGRGLLVVAQLARSWGRTGSEALQWQARRERGACRGAHSADAKTPATRAYRKRT